MKRLIPIVLACLAITVHAARRGSLNSNSEVVTPAELAISNAVLQAEIDANTAALANAVQDADASDTTTSITNLTVEIGDSNTTHAQMQSGSSRLILSQFGNVLQGDPLIVPAATATTHALNQDAADALYAPLANDYFANDGTETSIQFADGMAIYAANNTMDFVLGTNSTITVSGDTDCVNVKSSPYNAVGDGVTDDTAAIQAAIDALEASGDVDALYFPPGDYLLKHGSETYDASVPEGQYYFLKLGSSVDLTNRNVRIIGAAGSRILQTTSPVNRRRAHMLLCYASFNSLEISGLTFEKDSTPLSQVTSGDAINQNDAIRLIEVDEREVEYVHLDNVTFNNAHRSFSMGGAGTSNRGKLKELTITNCRMLNDYGYNSYDSSGSWGGGQQTYLTAWADSIKITGCLFRGASEICGEAATGSEKPLDGSLFGSARQMIFSGNTVKHFGIEAVFARGWGNYLGSTSDSFVVPATNDATTANITCSSSTDLSDLSDGDLVIIRKGSDGDGFEGANLYVTFRGWDNAAKEMTFTNPGDYRSDEDDTGYFDAGESISGDTLKLYQMAQSEFLAIIQDNDVEVTLPDALAGESTGYGIVSQERSIISGNNVRGGVVGVYLYDTTLYDNQTDGSIIAENTIIPTDADDVAATVNIHGILSYSANNTITGNRVVIHTASPTNGNTVSGISLRGGSSTGTYTKEGGYVVSGNTIIASVPSDGASYSTGIAFGEYTTDNVAVGNLTSGFSYGIGGTDSMHVYRAKTLANQSVGDLVPVYTDKANYFGDQYAPEKYRVYSGTDDGIDGWAYAGVSAIDRHVFSVANEFVGGLGDWGWTLTGLVGDDPTTYTTPTANSVGYGVVGLVTGTNHLDTGLLYIKGVSSHSFQRALPNIPTGGKVLICFSLPNPDDTSAFVGLDRSAFSDRQWALGTYSACGVLAVPLTPTWTGSVAYVVGDYVQPTTPDGSRYRCTVSGTTSATEPTWPTAVSTDSSASTVEDGGVTWREDGPAGTGKLLFVSSIESGHRGGIEVIESTVDLVDAGRYDLEFERTGTATCEMSINGETPVEMSFDSSITGPLFMWRNENKAGGDDALLQLDKLGIYYTNVRDY
jgi:hypothetical protein